MQTINRSKTAQRIIFDLQRDIAVLSEKKRDVELEKKCLEIGRDMYIEKRNWIKAASYTQKIDLITREINDIADIISPRLAELKRIEENELQYRPN